MRYERLLIRIVIGWYLLLALGAYFDQRPLWNDEQRVLTNITTFKSVDLFRVPLVGYQAFPRFYLWMVQQFSRLFNFHLLALRFFPMLAMLAAFFVWIKIARRVFVDGWNIILFIGSWAASLPLVYHAAELKPYSMDVLICGLIVLFLLEKDQMKSPRPYLSFFFPFIGLLSYPALFLLLLPLYNLVRGCFSQRRWLPELSYYLTGYLLMLGLVYLFDYRASAPRFLVVFWHDYFISFHSTKAFLNSFGKGMNNLVSRCFAESPRWVKGPSRLFIGMGAAFMIGAFWDRFKKDNFVICNLVAVSFVLFFIQLVLAMAWIYPFAVPRLMLFYTPLLLLMTVMAMDFIFNRQKVLGMLCRVVFGLYLVFVSAGIAWDIFIDRDLGAQTTLYCQIK